MSRRRHAPSCRHCPRVRQLGRDFQSWRASWERQRELAGVGYLAETTSWEAAHPAPTFRAYLVAMAGSGWPMSGQPARQLVA